MCFRVERQRYFTDGKYRLPEIRVWYTGAYIPGTPCPPTISGTSTGAEDPARLHLGDFNRIPFRPGPDNGAARPTNFQVRYRRRLPDPRIKVMKIRRGTNSLPPAVLRITGRPESLSRRSPTADIRRRGFHNFSPRSLPPPDTRISEFARLKILRSREAVTSNDSIETGSRDVRVQTRYIALESADDRGRRYGVRTV